MQFSLLIPCYRASRYLPRLREQITALEPQFDEVLLADDASDDDTYEVAQSLGFTIYRLDKNRGPGGARNELVKRSKGEWIHFLDADDFIESSFLKFMAPEALGNRDVILCSGDFIDESNGCLQKRWSFDNTEIQNDSVSSLFLTPVPSFCSLIKRSKFIEIGGFDEAKRCWEDGDLHLRLAAAGAVVHAITNVLSISPRHARGASGSHLYCHKCRLEFIKKYIDKGIPISPNILENELKNLGYLFLAEGELRLSMESYRISGNYSGEHSASRNTLFNSLLRIVPAPTSHFLSSAAKLAVVYLKRFKA